jgi:hypothetical protein
MPPRHWVWACSAGNATSAVPIIARSGRSPPDRGRAASHALRRTTVNWLRGDLLTCRPSNQPPCSRPLPRLAWGNCRRSGHGLPTAAQRSPRTAHGSDRGDQTEAVTTTRFATDRRCPRYPGKRPGRDPVDEDRSDHPLGGRIPDQGPLRAIPFVQQVDMTAGAARLDPPEHVHPTGDPPDVPVADLAAGRVDPHLRHPPGGPVERPEGAIGGHLHESRVGSRES